MQYIVNGLVVGGVYGLIAVGYTLVYGVAGIVNFAFGGLFMFGSYAALIALANHNDTITRFVPSLGLHSWEAILIGVVAGGIVGFLVERVAYRPLREQPTLTLLISSLAALLILEALGQFLFGAGTDPYPAVISGRSFTLAGAVISPLDVLVLVAACVATGVVWFVVRRTRWGTGMRAVAEDVETAKLLGINVEAVVTTVFVVGSAMAALSGILYGSLFNSASSTMGYTPGLEALVAAVLGGIGNVPGAFLGGVVLGVTETLAAAYVPNGSAYQDVVAFLALVLILTLRPQGLLGARVRERV